MICHVAGDHHSHLGMHRNQRYNPLSKSRHSKKSGFRTQTVKGIKVQIYTSQRTDVQLAPGTVTETVEVNGQSPLVETSENNLDGTLDSQQIEELPVSGRDFTKLLVMVPGSGGDPSGVADSGSCH